MVACDCGTSVIEVKCFSFPTIGIFVSFEILLAKPRYVRIRLREHYRFLTAGTS